MAPRLVCYGYLMNLKAAMRYALENHPEYRELMENYPFADWRMQVIGLAIDDIINKTGISDLRTRFVLIGGGYKGYLWALPSRFVRRSDKLGEVEKQQLSDLRGIINKATLPKFYYSCEDPEPEFYKSIKSDDEDLNAHAIDRMHDLFDPSETRKDAVKMIMEAKEGIWTNKQKA